MNKLAIEIRAVNPKLETIQMSFNDLYDKLNYNTFLKFC